MPCPLDNVQKSGNRISANYKEESNEQHHTYKTVLMQNVHSFLLSIDIVLIFFRRNYLMKGGLECRLFFLCSLNIQRVTKLGYFFQTRLSHQSRSKSYYSPPIKIQNERALRIGTVRLSKPNGERISARTAMIVATNAASMAVKISIW